MIQSPVSLSVYSIAPVIMIKNPQETNTKNHNALLFVLADLPKTFLHFIFLCHFLSIWKTMSEISASVHINNITCPLFFYRTNYTSWTYCFIN